MYMHIDIFILQRKFVALPQVQLQFEGQQMTPLHTACP